MGKSLVSCYFLRHSVYARSNGILCRIFRVLHFLTRAVEWRKHPGTQLIRQMPTILTVTMFNQMQMSMSYFLKVSRVAVLLTH